MGGLISNKTRSGLCRISKRDIENSLEWDDPLQKLLPYRDLRRQR